MKLDFIDNASFKYYADRDKYEKLEIDSFLISMIYNPGSYVIDIGANYGAFTLAAANLNQFKIAKSIISIEPDIRPFNALKKSIAKNNFQDSVQLHQLIIGSTEEKITLFINTRSSADNRTHEINSAPIKIKRSYKLSCTTVDELLIKSSIKEDEYFIIKMDIQGNEPRALKGMLKTLSNCKGFILFFEHCPYLIESANIVLNEYIKDLESLCPESIYQIAQNRIICIENFSQLRSVSQENNIDCKQNMQGACNDYIVVKNMKFSPLEPV
jgi:FkbM family methyltransferase